MKRTLRNHTSGNKKIDEGQLNAEQKHQFEKLKGMAKNYEGKSESEILKDLSQAVKKGKADGSLTNEKIDSIASTIAPMLNSQQKNKLDMLLKNIKK